MLMSLEGMLLTGNSPDRRKKTKKDFSHSVLARDSFVEHVTSFIDAYHVKMNCTIHQ